MERGRFAWPAPAAGGAGNTPRRLMLEQEMRIAILEEQGRLDALARFASKADRIRDLHPNQIKLLWVEPGLNEAEADSILEQPPAVPQAEAPAAEVPPKTKRYQNKAHPGREQLPARLRREDIVIDEPPARLPGGILPKELRRDITERLAVIPAEYFVERIVTVSYIFPGQPDKGVAGFSSGRAVCVWHHKGWPREGLGKTDVSMLMVWDDDNTTKIIIFSSF